MTAPECETNWKKTALTQTNHTMSIANLRLFAETEFNVRQCGRIPSVVFESSSVSLSAAHRAFRRQPCQPQTAAFPPVYSAEPHRRPIPVKNASLEDCIDMRQLSIESRLRSSTTASDRFSSSTSKNVWNAFTRSRSSINHRVIELYHGSGHQKRDHRSSLPVMAVKRRIVANDMDAAQKKTPSKASEVSFKSARPISEEATVSTRESSILAIPKVSSAGRLLVGSVRRDAPMALAFDDKHCDITFSQTVPSNQSGQLPAQDLTQSKRLSHLVVYHAIGDRFQSLALNDAESKSVSGKRSFGGSEEVKTYEVEIESPDSGLQSAAGLGGRGSTENTSLQQLLLKQLTLNERNLLASDESESIDVDSLNVQVSQFINTTPPSDQLYYFAYGKDTSVEWFSAHFSRNPGGTSWALLYGFRLHPGGGAKETWPLVEYSPKSAAVQGRVYLITQEEATLLNKYASTTLGFQTVVLPVWLMEIDGLDDECAVAEYCVPALIGVHPTRCVCMTTIE